MKNITTFFIALFLLSGCYSVETQNTYNKKFTWAKSTSKPIYLSFPDTKSSPFYFLLGRNTSEDGYKLYVRWKNPHTGESLFNGKESTLKFLVNNAKVITVRPIKRPKVVAYNINHIGQEEEALFVLSSEEFREIAYAHNVKAELTGRYFAVTGVFSSRNTLKAFRDFAENSH